MIRARQRSGRGLGCGEAISNDEPGFHLLAERGEQVRGGFGGEWEFLGMYQGEPVRSETLRAEFSTNALHFVVFGEFLSAVFPLSPDPKNGIFSAQFF